MCDDRDQAHREASWSEAWRLAANDWGLIQMTKIPEYSILFGTKPKS